MLASSSTLARRPLLSPGSSSSGSPRVVVVAPLRTAAAAGRRRARVSGPRAAASAEGASSSSASDDPVSSSSSSTGKAVKLDEKGEAEWRKIDKKVNKYPGPREFKAIGVDALADDGSTFAASMARCVTSVVGPVHVECVQSVPSRNGTYLAVRIGPVFVHTPEQVIEIFKNFKSDPRCKFCM